MNRVNLVSFVNFPRLPKLERLEVYDNELGSGIGDDQGNIKSLETMVSNCSNLRYLGLGGYNNNVGLKDIEKLKNLDYLEKLDLRGCGGGFGGNPLSTIVTDDSGNFTEQEN